MFRLRSACVVQILQNLSRNRKRESGALFISRQRQYSVAMDPLENAKKSAAIKAIDTHVQDGHKIGIGSGSTVVYAVERLAERVLKEGLDVTCVPTSFQSKCLISDNNLKSSDLETTPRLDVAIDGADEADDKLNLIKGGGGCQLQEKIVASAADLFVVIADYTKDSTTLGDRWSNGVPIEVVPMAYRPVQLRLESQFGGKAELRQAKKKAGPVVTDNGNFVLDWKFDKKYDWQIVNQEIMMIPGVVETGLFVDMVKVAYIGMQDGSVKEKKVDKKEK